MPNRTVAVEVLGHVMNSVMAQWVTRSLTATEAGDVLERAARLLL